MAIDVRPQRYGPSSDPSSVWHFADSDGVELKPISTEGTLLSCVPSLDHTEPHSDPTSFVSGGGGVLNKSRHTTVPVESSQLPIPSPSLGSLLAQSLDLTTGMNSQT